jgi:hypothetical protein
MGRGAASPRAHWQPEMIGTHGSQGQPGTPASYHDPNQSGFSAPGLSASGYGGARTSSSSHYSPAPLQQWPKPLRSNIEPQPSHRVMTPRTYVQPPPQHQHHHYQSSQPTRAPHILGHYAQVSTPRGYYPPQHPASHAVAPLPQQYCQYEGDGRAQSATTPPGMGKHYSHHFSFASFAS